MQLKKLENSYFLSMRSQTFSATDEELKSFVCKQQNTIE